MLDIDYILASYIVANEAFAQARTEQSAAKRDEAELQQFVMECAFYVLVFSRFEDSLKERAQAVINDRLKDARWISSGNVLDVDRLAFMNLVGILFRPGDTDYNTIKRRYDDRNKIAHGSLVETGTLIPQLIAELETLESRFPVL